MMDQTPAKHLIPLCAVCSSIASTDSHCISSVMQRSNTFGSGSGGREVLLELTLLDAQLTLPRDRFGE